MQRTAHTRLQHTHARTRTHTHTHTRTHTHIHIHTYTHTHTHTRGARTPTHPPTHTGEPLPANLRELITDTTRTKLLCSLDLRSQCPNLQRLVLKNPCVFNLEGILPQLFPDSLTELQIANCWVLRYAFSLALLALSVFMCLSLCVESALVTALLPVCV